MSRKERKRGFPNIEHNVDVSLRGLDDLHQKEQRKTNDSGAVTELTTEELTKQQKLRNRKGKKNNCMTISSDKLAKSHMKRLGHGYEREPYERI